MSSNFNIGVNAKISVEGIPQYEKGMNKVADSNKRVVTEEEKRQQAAEKNARLLRQQRNHIARMVGALNRSVGAMRSFNVLALAQNGTLLAGSAAIAGFGAAILGIVGIMAKAVSSWMKFEQGLIRAHAVFQGTQTDLVKLEKALLDLGRSSIFTFADLTKATEQLARTGMSMNDVLKVLPDTMNLAIAAGTDLTTATDILVRTLYGFGLAVEDATSAMDTLAFVSIKANVTLQQLGQSMKFVAPVARIAGISLEETSAALGLIGNAGMQASLAGTSLRGAMAKLLTPSREAGLLMKQLAIDSFIVDGKITSLADIIEHLAKVGAGATEIIALFGRRPAPAIAALVALGPRLREFTAEVQNAGGTIQDLADRNMEALSNQVANLQNKFSSIFISMGHAITAYADAKGAVTGLANSMEGLAAEISDQAAYDQLSGSMAELRAEMFRLLATKESSDKLMIDQGWVDVNVDGLTRLALSYEDARNEGAALTAAKAALLLAFADNKGTLPTSTEELLKMAAAYETLQNEIAIKFDPALAKLQRQMDKARLAMEKMRLELEGYTEAQIAAANPILAADKALFDAEITQKAFIAAEERLIQTANQNARDRKLLNLVYIEAARKAKTLRAVYGTLTDEMETMIFRGNALIQLEKEGIKTDAERTKHIEEQTKAYIDRINAMRETAQWETLNQRKSTEVMATQGQGRGTVTTMEDMIDPATLPGLGDNMLSNFTPDALFTFKDGLVKTRDEMAVYLIYQERFVAGLSVVADTISGTALPTLESLLFAQNEIKQSMKYMTDEQQIQGQAALTMVDGMIETTEQINNQAMAFEALAQVAGAATQALVAWATGTKTSAKEAANNFLKGMSGQMLGMAATEAVRGWAMTAAAAAYNATPGMQAFGIEAARAATIHFATAKMAAALGGGALVGAMATGGGGSAAESSAGTTGTSPEDMPPQSKRLPDITVIFESGSTVVAQSKEEFGREMAEEVIKAIEDGTR